MEFSAILVGTVRENKKNIVGYRVLDLKTFSGTTLNEDGLKQYGIDRIYGLGINKSKGGNKLIGTNGAIERYPIIDNNSGRLVQNNAVIVIGVSKGNKFVCSDYNGTIVQFTEKEVIDFASRPGNNIANGKIVTKDNKRFISAISGTYPVFDLPEIAQPKEMDKKPMSQEDAIKDIKICLNKVARAVIRRGYGIKDYDAVGDAMVKAGITFSYQMKEKDNFEKVVNLAIEMFENDR